MFIAPLYPLGLIATLFIAVVFVADYYLESNLVRRDRNCEKPYISQKALTFCVMLRFSFDFTFKKNLTQRHY